MQYASPTQPTSAEQNPLRPRPLRQSSVSAGRLLAPPSWLPGFLATVLLGALHVTKGGKPMAIFSKNYAPNFVKWAADAPYGPCFARIHELLSTQKDCHEHLLSLNKKIDKLLNSPPESEGSQDWYTPAQVMFDVLRAVELAHGFNAQVLFIDKVITSAAQFFSIMKNKHAFLDPFVTARHGAESHRLQWWIIMHDMKKNPAKYPGVSGAAELFAYCSTDEAGTKNKTDNLWYMTFDANQQNCDDFRAAENVTDYIKKNQSTYPHIFAAEQQQSLGWSSCVKMTSDKRKSLGAVAVNNPKNSSVKSFP